jgi:hypothetical protein
MHKVKLQTVCQRLRQPILPACAAADDNCTVTTNCCCPSAAAAGVTGSDHAHYPWCLTFFAFPAAPKPFAGHTTSLLCCRWRHLLLTSIAAAGLEATNQDDEAHADAGRQFN